MENMMQEISESEILGKIRLVANKDVAATKPGSPAIPVLYLHFIVDDDIKERVQQKSGVHLLGRIGLIGDYARRLISVITVKGFTDKDDIDLESGVKTEEVLCECNRKSERLVERLVKELEDKGNDVRAANDGIERIMKEWVDKGTVLKFNPVERVKELKDEGYGLLCIPLKDDDHALKFISIEAVKVSKDDGCPLKLIPVEKVKELKEDGYAYALFTPVETVNKLKDEYKYNIKMESGGVIEAAGFKSWCKNKSVEYAGYANDYIEIIARPEMGLLFSAAIMQNIYQIVTSGMVKTGKGKTLMKLNEAAFMMLLYGLVMPRRAAGHVALAIGVALASTAYLVPMSSAF